MVLFYAGVTIGYQELLSCNIWLIVECDLKLKNILLINNMFICLYILIA